MLNRYNKLKNQKFKFNKNNKFNNKKKAVVMTAQMSLNNNKWKLNNLKLSQKPNLSKKSLKAKNLNQVKPIQKILLLFKDS